MSGIFAFPLALFMRRNEIGKRPGFLVLGLYKYSLEPSAGHVHKTVDLMPSTVDASKRKDARALLDILENTNV